MKRTVTSTLVIALVAGLVIGTPVLAAGDQKFSVTVTNLTRGQSFTPILVASHKKGVKLFTPGMPASADLAALAEGGDVVPLGTALMAMADVLDVDDSGGLLLPGESVTVMVKTKGKFNHLSLASMLIPTNDAFFALNGIKGASGKKTIMVMAPAWDAGSEPNDEVCASIPGPVCGGVGGSPLADGEGFVHMHAGIHGIGDLVAADRDWRNAVASISITRMK
jgi:hypothetical protein